MTEVISADQLSLIYDHSDDLIFLLAVTPAMEFKVLSANKSFLDASGMREKDLIGRYVHEIYPTEDYQYLRDRYTETIKLGSTHRYETKTHLADRYVYIETMVVPIFDDEKNCTHLIGTSRDITERKQEQDALEAAKRRAENYLDISAAMIIALDTDCNLTMMNRKGYQVLGYEEGTLIGKNWCDLAIRPDRRQEYMTGFNEFVAGGVPRKHVNYLITSTGERLLFRSQNSFIHDEDGTIVGVISSGEDITDRHRAVQAMIAQQRTVAAEEVVTSVAHDFNNSLQGIIGNIEIAMAHADLPPESKRALEAASNLADDAAGRIDALRNTTESSSEPKTDVIAINELVNDVIEEARHLWKDLAARSGLKVELEKALAPSASLIEGRTNELRSVLYNIIKNAIEAIEAGHTDHTDGHIYIATREAGGDVVIDVKDDGAGMTEEDATRAFQAFFSTKGMEAGRGLGLAACHSIVRAHGGSIRITDTAPGAGTRMEIRLPLTARQLSAPETLPTPTLNQHHILWVDDDEAVRTIASGFIKLLDASGDVVDSAESAMERFRNAKYTMVITDIGMKGMSGTELAAVLRELNPDIPIIAITGWGDAALLDVDGADAFTSVLGKPVRISDLKDLLNQYPVLY